MEQPHRRTTTLSRPGLLAGAATFIITIALIAVALIYLNAAPAPRFAAGDPTLNLEMGNGTQFGDPPIITLEGYTIVTDGSLEPGDALELTLHWQANAPITERYHVFVHMQDAAGVVLMQRDTEPADGTRPTSTWNPGETIIDTHWVIVPDDVQRGTYILSVGLFSPESEHMLPTTLNGVELSDMLIISPPVEVVAATDSPIAIGSTVQLIGTEGIGIALREEPATDFAYSIFGQVGAIFVVLDGPREADGNTWWQVQDPTTPGRIGWVPQDNIEVLDEVAEQPTPTLVPSPTPYPIEGPGGFASPLDVGAFPEYVVTGGSGGGGGGGGCPRLDPTESVALIEADWDEKLVCLYDMPESETRTTYEVTMTDPVTGESVTQAYEGVEITVRLTSSQGEEFSHNYLVTTDEDLQVIPQGFRSEPPYLQMGWIALQEDRTPITLPLFFQAAQEYGEWQIEAMLAGSEDAFAWGSIVIEVDEPIYSISHIDDPLDPFLPPQYHLYHSGDHLIFRGRGWEALTPMDIVLYTADEARSTETSTVMIPMYATQVNISEDGEFYAEFVVGTTTPAAPYVVLFDPDPTLFEPARVGFMVEDLTQ